MEWCVIEFTTLSFEIIWQESHFGLDIIKVGEKQDEASNKTLVIGEDLTVWCITLLIRPRLTYPLQYAERRRLSYSDKLDP